MTVSYELHWSSPEIRTGPAARDLLWGAVVFGVSP
jgi:hypothetical protein